LPPRRVKPPRRGTNGGITKNRGREREKRKKGGNKKEKVTKKDKKTKAFTPGWLGTQVSGSTIGIVGLGRIGTEVAKRAGLGFGMKVLYHTRTEKQVDENLKATYCADLKDLLEQSDFVVLCVPQTPQTRHIINKETLAKMKKTAFLINVARGAVVDQEALVQALKSNTIAGAGLDVTDPEPLPRNHPLLSAPNTVITPHLGSATVATRQKMFDLSLLNLMAGLEGKTLVAPVPEAVNLPGRILES